MPIIGSAGTVHQSDVMAGTPTIRSSVAAMIAVIIMIIGIVIII